MRVVVQRVIQSNVKVSGEVIGEIKEGLMVLVSFVDEDNDTDLDWMTKKIINLRIFNAVSYTHLTLPTIRTV